MPEPKLVSLKRSRKERMEEVAPSVEDDYYPTSLHLTDEEVEKLGLGSAQVGQNMMLLAKVTVMSVSAHERANGKKRQSVSLELREAAVQEGPKKPLAERIYGKQ